MKFINREYEMNLLNKKWHQNNPQLIIIYGKRRVGKTELSIQFAKGKPHIYFLCDRIAEAVQLKKFAEAVGEFFKDEVISRSGFKYWEDAFKYIKDKNKKIIVIIDEFPYLAEANKAIPSIFQKAWDVYLKDSKVYLILLGSSISMMEETTLFYKAPLYGRRTAQLLIKPFKFTAVQELFKESKFEDVLATYSITGGTISYLLHFLGKNYIDVLRDNIFRKGEFLYEEIEFLLREELNEPRNYFVILEALSLGKNKLSEIINETGFDKGTVSRYISILNDLQITRKEVPLTERIPEKSRKSIYCIDDNFFNFWFRFVFRNKRYLEEDRVEEVIRLVRKNLIELMAKNYEKVASEILENSIIKNKLALKFSLYGSWWDKNEEIDLVALDEEDKKILFAEVKWSNKPVGIDIYVDLKRKSKLVIWGKKNRKEVFALFSKRGFTLEMKKMAKEEKVFLFEKDKLLR